MRLFILLFFFFFSPFSFSQTCNASLMQSYSSGGSTSWVSGTSEYICTRTESHVHSRCSGSNPGGYSLKSYIANPPGSSCSYDAIWLLIKPYVPPPPPPPDSCQDKASKSVEGEELRIGVTGPKVPFPSDFCHNSCQVTGPSGNYADVYSSLNGKWTATIFGDSVGTRTYTGSSCQADSDTSSEAKVTTCGKNQCPGQVNGVDVCVACTAISSDTGTDSGSTTQKADGSTVKTDSKSTTTCEGSSCNTTTTTTNTTINPDGSTAGTETKTDTKTELKENFCKENPTFVACVPSGFSASSCGAAPSCTGDAIQCAIAQQQHKSYCELMATSTVISELGVAAANGQAIPADHPLAQAEASPFNFSSAFTGASGGGGCPADVTVMGVTVPLSNTCEGLNALGLAALGISLIWAARVVFGG